EVRHEQRGAHDLGPEPDPQRRPRQALVPRRARRQAEHGRRARKAAGEEVARDLRLPHRLLQDRPAVVRVELAALECDPAVAAVPSRPPRNAPSTAATTAPAATPIAFHMSGSFSVLTTGSGGSP